MLDTKFQNLFSFTEPILWSAKSMTSREHYVLTKERLCVIDDDKAAIVKQIDVQSIGEVTYVQRADGSGDMTVHAKPFGDQLEAAGVPALVAAFSLPLSMPPLNYTLVLEMRGLADLRTPFDLIEAARFPSA